jgi:hypothetical protein
MIYLILLEFCHNPQHLHTLDAHVDRVVRGMNAKIFGPGIS